MYILYKVHGVHYEYVGMSFVFSGSTKKILGMQRQARRAVFIAVRLFDTDKKATKLNRARIFTESQVCFSTPIITIWLCVYVSWRRLKEEEGMFAWNETVYVRQLGTIYSV